MGVPTLGQALYNIDFEQLEGQGTYKEQAVGPGPDGGVDSAGDYWNVLEISEAGDSAPIGISLNDSSGAASGVSFTFTSLTDASGNQNTIGAYGHAPTAVNAVVGEYVFISYIATWEYAGLTPGGTYDIYLYTGGYDAVNGDNYADYNIDVDGDGVEDGWA